LAFVWIECAKLDVMKPIPRETLDESTLRMLRHRHQKFHSFAVDPPIEVKKMAEESGVRFDGKNTDSTRSHLFESKKAIALDCYTDDITSFF
jgi:hypothetical protein